jgi:branched-chain amino acid transport system substrate-binding protein
MSSHGEDPKPLDSGALSPITKERGPELLRIIRNTAAVLLAAAVFVAGARVGAQPRVPYELTAILSQSGPGAFVGQAAGKSMVAMESYINSTGGIHGRPLKMTVLDDQSSPQVAVQLVNGLIAQKRPAFIGPMLTASCEAVIPLISKAGPVAYCVSPFVNPPRGGYMFMQQGSPLDLAITGLRFLKGRGAKRIAVLNATDASSQAADNGFEQAFGLKEFSSLQQVVHMRFSPSDITLTAQASQIKAANPDAIVTWSVGAPFAATLRALHDAGINVPVLSNSVNETADQMQQVTDVLPRDINFVGGASWVVGAHEPAAVIKQQEILRKYLSAAGLPTNGAYAATWDLELVLIDALRHVPENPSALQVHDYLTHIYNFPGTNVIYDFRFGQQSGALESSIVSRWDAAHGRFVPASYPGGRPAE